MFATCSTCDTVGVPCTIHRCLQTGVITHVCHDCQNKGAIYVRRVDAEKLEMAR